MCAILLIHAIYALVSCAHIHFNKTSGEAPWHFSSVQYTFKSEFFYWSFKDFFKISIASTESWGNCGKDKGRVTVKKAEGENLIVVS